MHPDPDTVSLGRAALEALLSGPRPSTRLRAARDDGRLVALIPELERCIGYDQGTRFHTLPLDEHLFAVVDAIATETDDHLLRLAALLHDIGKPDAAFRGADGEMHYGGWHEAGYLSHEEIGSIMAGRILRRLGYDRDAIVVVETLVRWHMPREQDAGQAAALAGHLGRLTTAVCLLRRADAAGKGLRPTRALLARLAPLEEHLDAAAFAGLSPELALTGTR